jgi:spermidine/putrescine transport system substrate-binding protein
VAALLAESIDYVTPVPGAKQEIESQAAAASDAATKSSLLATANSTLVFPSQTEFSKTHYYRVLSPSEATQWNNIFNAVILG